jgi:hypothetical protein
MTESKKTTGKIPELKAMDTIYKVLKGLDVNGRKRVTDWLNEIADEMDDKAKGDDDLATEA